MLIEEILILGLFLVIPLIIMVISMVILLIIIIGTPLVLRIILKNLSILKKYFNATIEEKLNKIDDMSRSIDRISHDVENLKMKIFVPKVEELKLFMFLW